MFLRQLAWLITFVASIVAQVKNSGFPNFAWWVIAYTFCVIVGVFIVVGSDSTQTYHVAVRQTAPPLVSKVLISWQIVGFLAAGLTYAPSLINTLVYSSDGAKEASAAGFILLSMVMVGLPATYAASPC